MGVLGTLSYQRSQMLVCMGRLATPKKRRGGRREGRVRSRVHGITRTGTGTLLTNTTQYYRRSSSNMVWMK